MNLKSLKFTRRRHTHAGRLSSAIMTMCNRRQKSLRSAGCVLQSIRRALHRKSQFVCWTSIKHGSTNMLSSERPNVKATVRLHFHTGIDSVLKLNWLQLPNVGLHIGCWPKRSHKSLSPFLYVFLPKIHKILLLWDVNRPSTADQSKLLRVKLNDVFFISQLWDPYFDMTCCQTYLWCYPRADYYFTD